MVDFSGHWSYDLLKQFAASVQTSQSTIEELKCVFQEQIGSVRRRACIRSLADLIDCLERRDVLSESNIEPLREVADYCGGRLAEAVSDYVAPKAASAGESINQYREQRLAEEVKTQLHLSERIGGKSVVAAPPTGPAVSHVLTEQKRAAIYKVIAREISTFWRSFGRELEISQGTMDEIELQYPRDFASRVYKLLQMFEEDELHDPKQHVSLICKALDACRRKDLRRKVEQIMSH